MKKKLFLLLFLFPLVLSAHGGDNFGWSLGIGFLLGITIVVLTVPKVRKNKELDGITKNAITGAICVGALLILPLVLLFVFM